ncbi:MAG: FtsW/RodA/SpoVE family cell cycle protein, partial [Deinococcales bacterium]
MDRLLVTIQVLLGALGVVGVTAAAATSAPEHALRFLAGLVLTVLVARMTPKRIVRLSPLAYGIMLA